MNFVERFVSLRTLCLSMSLLAVACGDDNDPTGSGGVGTVAFTTWGEGFIEEQIPPESEDEGGFVDGWTLTYSKFLVNFDKIQLRSGEDRFSSGAPKLFDNKLPDVKSVITFENVPAKAYTDVSYEIAPVTEETELADGVSEDDKQLMIDGGYSLWLEGSAEKDDITKSFAWGLDLHTLYQSCHSEQNGKDELGLVVTNNATVEAQLTTHGDHPFYDRLEESENPAITTKLRFDAMAEADADDDGVVTLEELDEVMLDVTRYNPSSFEVTTLGAFVRRLGRTIGHFRGEGECNVSAQ